MRVGPVAVERKGNLSVVSAEIEWEAQPTPGDRLYIAVPAELADLLSPTPHTFLLAALLSAGTHREARVQLDEPISPLLAEGAGDALGILSHWYGDDPSVEIEAPDRASVPETGITPAARLQIKAIAEWDAALDSLIVCTDWTTQREGPPNCGTCEKCLRTLAMLKALGVERELPTFPEGSLTPQAVRERARWISTDAKFDQWREVEPMLRARVKSPWPGPPAATFA